VYVIALSEVALTRNQGNPKYKGESNENLISFLKIFLLCRSGTKLYQFSK
jgi:hypothetical protein